MSSEDIPNAVIDKLIEEVPANSPVNDVISHLKKSLDETHDWKRKYYHDYSISDEFKQDIVLDQVKTFVWSFMPPNHETNNNQAEWKEAYIRRYIYDKTLGKTFKNTDYKGWQLVVEADTRSNFGVIPQTAARFGFKFHHDVFINQFKNENMPMLFSSVHRDINASFKKAFLSLTLDAFFANPTSPHIVFQSQSVTNIFNPHRVYGKALGGFNELPVTDDSFTFVEEVSVFPHSLTVEYAAYPNREWGMYIVIGSDFKSYGLLWGQQFIDYMLQHSKYWQYVERANFQEVSDVNDYKKQYDS